jgi:CO/xanthine dehydrogenase FAD-binding subunit
VLLDGALVNSCLTPLAHADGASITTIEGVAADRHLHAIQEAFVECGGAQCGICTPGMVLAAHALLARNSDPTDDEVRAGLSGNLCRCTGYMRIFESVFEAVRRRHDARARRLRVRHAGVAGRGARRSRASSAVAAVRGRHGPDGRARGRPPAARPLRDLSQCVELTGIGRDVDGGLTIGALTTYTAIRESASIGGWAMLKLAAARDGGVATQNRGRSAATSRTRRPPPTRRPCCSLTTRRSNWRPRPARAAFRTRSSTRATSRWICARRAHRARGSSASSPAVRPSSPGETWRDYYRKVGTRRAQAISKVCVAGSIRMDGASSPTSASRSAASRPPWSARARPSRRCAAASSRPRAVDDAVAALQRDIAPIDDIRSTARYRARVAANLLREFLTQQ